MKRIIVACFVFVALACAAPAYAGPSDKPPTKESLLAAWEQVQKANPNTVKFEKTGDKDAYSFETTTFPYKGKLHVLNLLIDKHPGDYYEYEEEDAPESYIGIVEVSLDGLDKDFREKYYASYETWARDNRLHYEVETAKWFTPVEWTKHKQVLRSAKYAAAGGTCTSSKSGVDLTAVVTILLGLFGFLFVLGWLSSSQQKKAKKLQDEYREMNKGIVERSVEALAVQKEILEILRKKA